MDRSSALQRKFKPPMNADNRITNNGRASSLVMGRRRFEDSGGMSLSAIVVSLRAFSYFWPLGGIGMRVEQKNEAEKQQIDPKSKN